MRAGGYGRFVPIDPSVRDAIDELARYVQRPADVQEGLRLLVLSVVDTVVSADFASISVRNLDGSVETSHRPIGLRSSSIGFSTSCTKALATRLPAKTIESSSPPTSRTMPAGRVSDRGRVLSASEP